MKVSFSTATRDIRPWTQILELDWRPQLRFLERRLEVMHGLESQGHMRSFKIDEHRIAARFVGAEFTMTVESAEIWVGRSSEALRTSLDALRFALSVVSPDSCHLMRAWFTHVIPMPGDYDALRARSAHSLFTWWPSEVTDYSVLADGRARLANTNYQCELGLVSAAEILPRVNRDVGRGGQPRTQMRLEVEAKSLPTVALFADSTWTYVPESAIGTETLFERSLSFLDAVTAEANALAVGTATAIAAAADVSGAANVMDTGSQ